MNPILLYYESLQSVKQKASFAVALCHVDVLQLHAKAGTAQRSQLLAELCVNDKGATAHSRRNEEEEGDEQHRNSSGASLLKRDGSEGGGDFVDTVDEKLAQLVDADVQPPPRVTSQYQFLLSCLECSSTNRTAGEEQQDDGEEEEEVGCSDDGDDGITVNDVFTVLAHFLVGCYDDIGAAAICVQYLSEWLSKAASSSAFFMFSSFPFIEAVANTLASERLLRYLTCKSGYLRHYLTVLERAADICPQLVYEKMTKVDAALLHSAVFMLPGRVAKWISAEMRVLHPVVSSIVRIITSLFVTAQISRALLTTATVPRSSSSLSTSQSSWPLISSTPSPLCVYVENLSFVPSECEESRLRLIQGMCQILVAASSVTKQWLEHFAQVGTAKIVTQELVAFCAAPEHPLGAALDNDSCILFDTLCLLLSLPDSGAPASTALYHFLLLARWDAKQPESAQWPSSIFATKMSRFGWTLLVKCCTAAMAARPRLFHYLAMLLYTVLRVQRGAICDYGAVSEDVVEVMVQFLNRGFATHDTPPSLLQHELVCSTVCLCAHICRTQCLYKKQKSGAAALCKFAVQLITNQIPVIANTAIKAVVFCAAAATSSATIFFTKLVDADVFESVSSELIMPLTSNRRKLSLLHLIQTIISQCPDLQHRFVHLAGNVVQQMRSAAICAHESLAPCSRLLSSIKIVVYDQPMNICNGLLGLMLDLRPETANSLVACCWALQTVVRMVSKETCVKDFFSEHLTDMTQLLGSLCQYMAALFRKIEENGEPNVTDDFCVMYDTLFAPCRQHEAVIATPNAVRHYFLCCDALLLLLHVMNVTQCSMASFFVEAVSWDMLQHCATGPFVECRLFSSIVVRMLAGMASWCNASVIASPAPASSSVRFMQDADACRISLQDFALGWDVARSVGDELFDRKLHRIVNRQYLVALFAIVRTTTASLTRSMSVANVELIISIFEFLCSHFQVRVENMIALSACDLLSVASEVLLTAANKMPAFRSRASGILTNMLNHLGTYSVCTEVLQAQLYLLLRSDESRQQRQKKNGDKKRQSTSGASKTAAADSSGDTDTAQNNKNNNNDDNSITDNHNESSSPLEEDRRIRVVFDEGDAVRTLRVWDQLLQLSLPSLLPKSFLTMGFGCEATLRSRALQSVLQAQAKRDSNILGGVDVAVNYEVWRSMQDVAFSAVQWVLIDPSHTHNAGAAGGILLSLHFEKNRVAVELGITNAFVLYVSVHVRGIDGTKSKRVMCSKLGPVPHRQWVMLTLSVTNFCNKPSGIRSKFSTGVKVGMHTFRLVSSSRDGVQPTYESCSQAEEIEFAPSLREKSFSSCTSLSYFNIGGIPKNLSMPPATANKSRSSGINNNNNGAETETTLAHQLFFASCGLFFGELSPFDEAVFFALGSDGLFGLDFVDRAAIVNLFPVIAKLIIDKRRNALFRDVSILASLWTRSADAASEPVQFGASTLFPFTKASREKVACVVGVADNDLQIVTRLEGHATQGAGSFHAEAASPGASPSFLGHDSTGSSFADRASALGAGGSVATTSIVASPIVLSALQSPQMLLQQQQQASAANLTQSMAVSGSADFVSNPRTKGLVYVPLQVALDDIDHDPDDKPSFKCLGEQPAVYSVCPFYSLVDATNGVHSLLWLATLFAENSAAQIAAIKCISSMIALHESSPISNSLLAENSKLQTMTLLSAMLHARIGVSAPIAQALCNCCGQTLIARPDVVPLLLDFSLWARSDEAVFCITNHLMQLQKPGQFFSEFNTQVLARCDILDVLLLHLHMHFSGSTSVTWSRSIIAPIKQLLIVLSADCLGAAQTLSSAAWLATEEFAAPEREAEALDWILCLLDTVTQAVSSSNQQHALTSEHFPDSFAADVVALLRCRTPDVRRRALVLLDWVPLIFPVLVAVVTEYQARSLLFPDVPCITNDELRTLLAKIAGSEASIVAATSNGAAPLALKATGREKFLLPLTMKPLLFVITALIPSIEDESQKLQIVQFLSDLFRSNQSVQLSLMSRVFAPTLDSPLTSYLLFAFAENGFRKASYSLPEDASRGESLDDAVSNAIVELLIEICSAAVALGSAPSTSARVVGAVDTICTVVYSIFNSLIGDDEVGSRCATPRFYSARRHVLNVCTACIAAFERLMRQNVTREMLEAFWQFLDLVNDLTALLYFRMRSESRDDLASSATNTEASPLSASSAGAAAAAGGTAVAAAMLPSAAAVSSSSAHSQHSSADRHEYAFCQAVRAREVKALKTRRMFAQVIGKDGPFNKDNIECMPIYALQVAAKVCFLMQNGQIELPDKRDAAKMCSQLHQQQLKLASYLLSLMPRSGHEDIQVLALLHLMRLSSTNFGFDLPASPKNAKDAAQQHVVPPPNAQWSVANNIFSPRDSLLVFSAVKYKDSSNVLLFLSLIYLVGFSEVNNARQLGCATLALELLRVLLYHNRSQIRKEIADSMARELERLCSSLRDVRALATDVRLRQRLSCQPEVVFSASGLGSWRKYTQAQVDHAVSRATQNPRVASSYIVPLEPQRSIAARERIDARMSIRQTTVLKRATFYRRGIEEDGNAIMAVNAAYRFSLLPWWGELAMLYTAGDIDIDRWELDRFMGPEWERIRLRRFLRQPRIASAVDAGEKRFIPAVAAEIISPLDDVTLLSSFSVTAIPQVASHRVLRSDATPYKCKLILPMDRVPILLYVSPTTISYVVEWFRPARISAVAAAASSSFPFAAAAATSTTTVPDAKNEDATTEAADGARTTDNEEDDASDLVSSIRTRQQTFSSTAVQSLTPSDFKYQHEIPSFRRVISILSIRAVWPRRNLLQQTSIELLLSTGETLFVAFKSESERKLALDLITSLAKPYLDKTLTLNDSNKKIWRGWWEEGRITNFKYLMYLNWVAGRSYGDLRQYPVFPHVISDYVSEEAVSLETAASFRRFDRPMGAQSVEREDKTTSLYEELKIASQELLSAGEAMNYDMVPRHYGSHYSPPGAVLHFLVRIQPFTDYFLDMNSHLDDPNRVFDSMATAYSISSTGKDVKEMIPEFYCVPHMFLNNDRIPFGMKQDGTAVDSVTLPPWAPTPRHLTEVLRRALESRHVSENLHHWIDLVFGFRQRGKDAVAAFNVFHALTYEGAVNLQRIDDTVMRLSNETQIDNFGQTPMQLFNKPHKQRVKPGAEFYTNPCPTVRFDASLAKSSVLLFLDKVGPALSYRFDTSIISFCRPKLANAALGADEGNDWILSTAASKPPVPLAPNIIPFNVTTDGVKDYLLLRLQSVALADGKDTSRELSTLVFPRASLTCFVTDAPTCYIGTVSGQIFVAEVVFVDDVNEIETLDIDAISSSHWEFSMQLLHTGDARTANTRGMHCIRHVDTMAGHTAAVQCVHLAPEWGVLLSIGRDRVVAMWDVHRRLLIRCISAQPSSRVCEVQSRPPPYALPLLYQNIISPAAFVPQVLAVNPRGGGIVVAGFNALQRDAFELQLFTHNGDLVARIQRRQPTTAVLALGPYIFAAEGRAVQVYDSFTLQFEHELQHPCFDDTISSLSMNPFGTLLAACDRLGNCGTWKVQQ